MEREYTFEEIEEYLSGTLTKEITSALEEKVRQDPAFAMLVQKHREAHELVRLHTIQQLKQKVKQIHQAENTKSTIPWMKLAASLILVFLMGGYFLVRNNFNAQHIADEVFEPYPNKFNTMGNTEQNQFTLALATYDKGAYEEAIALFEQISNDDELAIPSRLYTGVSYLALNKSEEAIATLQKANETPSLYTETINWYLALAYIKAGKEANAKAILEEIVATNAYQSAQAKTLLEKLDSGWRKIPGI